MTHGLDPEPNAAGHLAAARRSGYTLGAYHYLTPGAVADQVVKFLAALDPAYQFCALDVEQAGVSAQDVLGWCHLFSSSCHLPLVLYGNNLLARTIVIYPELAKYGVWWAAYGPMLPTSSPPYAAPSVPAGLKLVGWQFAGDNGRLSPYMGAIDLTQWYEVPGAPMTPVVSHGSKLGLHSITNHQLLPIVRAAVAAGVTYPVVKMVNDASPFVEIKRISPRTLTILRLMPPNKDDEGLQNADTWDDAHRQAWAKRLIDLYFANAHAGADYYDPINEPGAHGVAIYTGYGLALLELIRQANAAGIKLSLPALPQGTPEYAEMQALRATGLFRAMRAGGHIWDCHEGVYHGQPIDQGVGDLIPGAPSVPPGAGSANFRHRYLYAMLDPDEVVPLVVSEWYGGTLGLEQIKWYDTRLREEPYALAFLPFTIDPTPTWASSDYTGLMQDPATLAYLVSQKDKDNMPVTLTDADYAALLLANNQAATILQKYKTVVLHTMATLTNQQVINLFYGVFGGYGELTTAGLLTPLAAARNALYVGPPVESLPGLTAAQKASVIAALPSG